MYAPVIGIDFGTTKTLIAYPSEHGFKPEIAHLGRERNSLPTSAFIGESGIWEFGDDADDYACDAALADRYISGFKLKLGSTAPSLQVFGTQGFQAFSAQRISSLFFAHLREKCTKEVFNGRAVSRAVITHPVKFSPAQLHDLRNAAEQAGFSDITLMREPEAAGLAFCRLCPQDLFSGTALIVDWGGGTLDLALVSRKTDSVQIHNNYVAGHNHIGGNEFDELLWKYVNARLQHEKGVKLSEDSVDFQRLQKKKIRAAKEKLSRTDSAMLSLSGNHGAYPTLKLTREELESVLKPAVQAGVDLIGHLLNSIQEGSLKPSQVLLIGGSSQIPLISRLIEETTQLPCRRWQYSHEAVALGAAIGKEDLPTKERSIFLYLTDSERSHGTKKDILLDNEYLTINIPCGVNVGSRLRLSAASTGLSEDILITIHPATTVTLRLSAEEFRTGGNKTIIVEGNEYEITLPKNTHPDQTCYFNLDDIGSVFVNLLPLAPANKPGHTPTDSRTISLALTEKERLEGATKNIRVNNEYNYIHIEKAPDRDIPSPNNESSINQKAQASIALKKADKLFFSGAYAAAIPLYQEAAEKGNADAMWKLAIRYKDGLGTRKNRSKAKYWCSKAVEAGHEDAKRMLNELNLKNRTVKEINPATALLTKADKLFFSGAYAAAIPLYQEAAEKGNADAMWKLAIRYKDGIGTPKNLHMARYWCSKAIQAGHEDAKLTMKQLTPDLFGAFSSLFFGG